LRLTGVPHLMACLLYGAGLRVLECAPLTTRSRTAIAASLPR
jgi:hypothetical protein